MLKSKREKKQSKEESTNGRFNHWTNFISKQDRAPSNVVVESLDPDERHPMQIRQMQQIRLDNIKLKEDDPFAKVFLSVKPKRKVSRQKSIRKTVRFLNLGSARKLHIKLESATQEIAKDSKSQSPMMRSKLTTPMSSSKYTRKDMS